MPLAMLHVQMLPVLLPGLIVSHTGGPPLSKFNSFHTLTFLLYLEEVTVQTLANV